MNDYNPSRLSLAPGSRLGAYEITAQIGAGGMGEVYRATDANLKRSVAIKLLPASVAADPERLARFQREAEVLAALNHPNIAAIYGLERSGGTTALVMELVEGDDLSQRIARGAILLGDALPIARQIAEALEAAHEQGIIHRDLKPANIKVRADGTVKVLDFGLAKAVEPASVRSASAGQALSMSPTITTPAMTQAGMILGTAAYMSPEQAKGRPLDKRADIWAFGVVVYEMLAGRRLFDAEDVSETLAAVLTRDLGLAALPAATPPRVRALVRDCLVRDPRQRLRDIGEARRVLDAAIAGAPDDRNGALRMAQPPPVVSRGERALPWMVAGISSVALVALLLAWAPWRPGAALPVVRADIVTPPTDSPTSFALSPDGQQIVFAASGEGGSRLWLRSLATASVQPLAGTEGATSPFWAPDGRSIGFFAGARLKRIDLGGGAPQTLAPASAGNGGTWIASGVIVFAPDRSSPLMRVSATGGAATAVTTLEPQQQAHIFPRLLPDGRRFLFYALGPVDAGGIYLGTLDGRAATRLTSSDGAGVSLPSGWLLWVRAGTLVAQRLDAARAALTGEPIPLADQIMGNSFVQSAVSVADTGLVAYRTGTDNRRQPTWMNRSGTAQGTVGEPDTNSLSNPRASPDGRRVAVARIVQGNQDLWLLGESRTSRLTFNAANDLFPLWSPDGARLVFRSNRTGQGDIYHKLASGAGVEERLVASDQAKTPSSWSADGRFVLYHSTDAQTNADLWVVPMMGDDHTPYVFLKTPFIERWGAFSPDGRWVAYHSNESGRMEIYVRPFVTPGAAGPPTGAAGGQWQVSTAGGIYPLWRPDGKELYYLNPAGAMMAAPITVTGSTFEPGAPRLLFPTRIFGGGVDSQQGRQYDVASDGRFLINTLREDASAPITLLINWNPESKK